jgi:arylamine N-acetyltransferase
MAADPWEIDRLDLAGYLGRLGIAAREPSREALNELHEAHVRSFTFDNIDVLLAQHPGVGLAAVQEKFVGRDGVATASHPPKPRPATMPST